MISRSSGGHGLRPSNRVGDRLAAAAQRVESHFSMERMVRSYERFTAATRIVRPRILETSELCRPE
jgi:hypothetical protein